MFFLSPTQSTEGVIYNFSKASVTIN